ncbi:DUF2780 domain-containing protein [Vibrio parahaemolyticus]|nr:DUF2780 domain-containing protein [Vibrio parahaemolyticus]EJE8775010.1 DUF2780 domain-containing protein [Vibrio parahaemolyticus]
MKKHIMVISALSVALLGCQTTGTPESTSSVTSLASSALSGNALSSALQAFSSKSTGETKGLASLVQESTGLTSEQAMGSVSSLLALAQSSLGQSQNNELGKLIPGYDALKSTGLSALITNQGALETAFSQLGISPSMISTIAPVLINALKSQGASSGLMKSLSALWK